MTEPTMEQVWIAGVGFGMAAVMAVASAYWLLCAVVDWFQDRAIARLNRRYQDSLIQVGEVALITPKVEKR